MSTRKTNCLRRLHPLGLAVVAALAALVLDPGCKGATPQATEAVAAPAPAPPAPSASGLSEERAQQIVPRADLSGLTDEQRAQFLEIAGDTFDYAGCNDTLARCLGAGVKDKHALRMTELIKALILDGLTPTPILELVERYYGSFGKEKRKQVRSDDCPTLGEKKAPVAVVEYSDYQCPGCAAAVKPLHDMVEGAPGKVHLCFKYFPLPQHPRAAIAAACAEFAFKKGGEKKFWEMSGMLFSHQHELEDAQLKSFAAQLGLDGNAMLKEAYAGKFDSTIEKQKQEGLAAMVPSTPSLLFNGRMFVLPLKPNYLLRSVEDEEEWQRGKGNWEKD